MESDAAADEDQASGDAAAPEAVAMAQDAANASGLKRTAATAFHPANQQAQQQQGQQQEEELPAEQQQADAAEAQAKRQRSVANWVHAASQPPAAAPNGYAPPPSQQQQQQFGVELLAAAVPSSAAAVAAAAAAASNHLLLPPHHLAGVFHHQLLAPGLANDTGLVSGPGPPPAAAAAGASVPPGVLQAHLSALPVSWPASRPVLGLSGSTIQAAAAAAAAAAASATRAAMGQDPTLGWTPAMAAAAMVAAAGAHEGAAATAVNAAAAAGRRHGRHGTRTGRRHKPAAKDEDISSRQGSLRILASASAGHATKAMSAELSDAAQPPAAGGAGSIDGAEEQPQCAAGDNSTQGLAADTSNPGSSKQQQQHGDHSPARVGVAAAPQQQLQQLLAARLAAQQQAAAEGGVRPCGVASPGGLLAAGGRGLVSASAGLSSGPAAAEVKGLADKTPRHSALCTDEPEGPDISAAAGPDSEADAGGAAPLCRRSARIRCRAVTAAGVAAGGPARALEGSAGGSPRVGGAAPAEQHPAAATATGSPPPLSPTAADDVAAAAPDSALAQQQQSPDAPAAAGDSVQAAAAAAATDELSRQFQEQQLLQRRMCLAALEPAASPPHSGSALGHTAPTGAVANPTEAGSGHTGAAAAAAAAPGSDGEGCDSASGGRGSLQPQQQPAATSPGGRAGLSAHWPPLSLQQALTTAANGLSLPLPAVAAGALSPAAALAARRAPAAVPGAPPQPAAATGCLPLQLADPSLPMGGLEGPVSAAAAAATTAARVPVATGPEVLLPGSVALPGVCLVFAWLLHDCSTHASQFIAQGFWCLMCASVEACSRDMLPQLFDGPLLLPLLQV